jgi:hypothetical protein
MILRQTLPSAVLAFLIIRPAPLTLLLRQGDRHTAATITHHVGEMDKGYRFATPFKFQ